MGKKNKVLLLVDMKSFPKKCGELSDLCSLMNDSVDVSYLSTESPTEYFRKALDLREEYELIIPVTRNLFIRDRLRMEGVNLVICL